MEYNDNIYVTILTINAVALGVSENKRKSNDGSITILEYSKDEIIPQNILNVVINTMTHQEALQLIISDSWKAIELPKH